MGIKNLNSVIERFSANGRNRSHLSMFSNKTFAIDTNVYLYKYLYGKSNHINGMFFMINKFKKFNITPIFIFDGKPPEEKLGTIQNRKLMKHRLEERLSLLRVEIKNKENDDIEEIQKEIETIEKKIIYVNKTVIDKTKILFDLMGIIYINAQCEAEHYCSKLCNLDIVDGVVSEDMDTIACGSKLVLRNFTNRDDYVDAYYFDDILYDFEISKKSFIDLCILLGNDYNYRPRGYTPEEIYLLLKKHKSIENLKNDNLISNWYCDYEKIRQIIKLESIYIDHNSILSQYSKKPNISLLKGFLKDSSTIDEKTYLHRINLIYSNNHKKDSVPLANLYKSKFQHKLYNNYQPYTNHVKQVLEF